MDEIEQGGVRYEANGGRAVLKWWPVIAFALIWMGSGIGAYYSIKTEMATAGARAAVIERTLKEHEERNAVERAELLYEVRELRTDVKRLVEQQAVLLRGLK